MYSSENAEKKNKNDITGNHMRCKCKIWIKLKTKYLKEK